MLDQKIEQIQAPTGFGEAPPQANAGQDVLQLLSGLQSRGLLTLDFPRRFLTPRAAQIGTEAASHLIQRHLTREGWRLVLRATRSHNRENSQPPWDLARPADFLAALRLIMSSLDTSDTAPVKTDAEVPVYERRLIRGPRRRMRRQVAVSRQVNQKLQAELATAELNGELLPRLLEDLYDTNPLREGYVRERVRHRVALVAGGLIAAIAGIFLGVLEGIIDVLISGIGHFAPIIAPALVVGLLTLLFQTVSQGTPTTWEMAIDFISRALWNGSLAFGATIIAYGVWNYFNTIRTRGQEAGRSDLTDRTYDDSDA